MKRSRLIAGILLALLAAPGCTRNQDTVSLTPRERALALMDANQPDQAIALLRPELDGKPDDLGLARAYVQAHVKAGRTEGLITELKASLATSATASRHYMLGLAYFSRAADAQGPALESFRQAIALSPDGAELHFRLGLVLLESEREAEALPSLERAVTLEPERAGYRLPVAKAYARVGREEQAVAALRALVQLGPTREEIGVARQLTEAMADPFSRFPKAAEAKLQEGLRALQELDLPHDAILAFEEILLDYPDLGVVHALLGLAHQRLDDAGRAVEAFRRAIELSPRDAKNHLYLAELYQSRRRFEQAQEAYRKAVELNPLMDLAYFRLGDLALERGELERAKEAFTLLVRLTPDSTPARGKLAAVLQLQRDFVGAERELKHVLALDPENLEFQLRMGLVSYERWRGSSKPEERKAAGAAAEEWLRKVLDEQPDNALASRALEQLTQRR